MSTSRLSSVSQTWATAAAGRRLLLIRHGETAYNRDGRYQGQLDVPLNTIGVEQARCLATRLQDEPLALCVSSDLARARVTAEVIARVHGITVQTTAALREAHLGVLQGRSWGEAAEALGDDAGYLDRRDVRAKPAGGESLLDVRRRVRRFLAVLAPVVPNAPPGDIVVVGHGGSLRALLPLLLSLPTAAAWGFRFDNCALTVVEIDRSGRAVLTAHNDRTHLQ